ncbi:MAG: PAC2 family protein [Candidatus Bathyarchaeota archaeon]
MQESVKIVEKVPIPSDATMLIGLPDVGLVGLIATSYLITELGFQEIAYVESDLLPPVVVLHNGLPYAPLRIYGNEKVIAVISELAIPANALHTVMRKLMDWAEAKKVKQMISMGGIPTENRQTIKAPEVFGAASNQELLDSVTKKGLKLMKEGYIVGPQALSMRYAANKKIQSIALLAQSFYNFNRQRDIILSLGTGTRAYFGDLNDPGDIWDTRWNVDLGLEYFLAVYDEAAILLLLARG